MFNFDKERFLKLQNGAVSLKDTINEVIDDIMDSKGIDNVFLIGSGGAGILMQTAEIFMEKRSTLPVFTENVSEFMLTNQPNLTDKSLIIIPSLSGTTEESVELSKFCKAKNISTISLVGNEGTPLAENTDYYFINKAHDDTSTESFMIQSFLIVARIMANRNEFNMYDEFIDTLVDLPNLLVQVKEQAEDKASNFAKNFKDTPWHIIVGSGLNWPETYYYSMCILEEMQWIKTRPVHASDFFHGTLELVEKDTSIIVFKGEDETRNLTDRVEKFAHNYSNNVTVFDTKEYSLNGIPEELRKILSPIVLATSLERVSIHLESQRNHPLSTRRYYKKVEY